MGSFSFYFMYTQLLSDSIHREGKQFIQKLKGGRKKTLRYSNENVYKRARRKQSGYTRSKRRIQ